MNPDEYNFNVPAFVKEASADNFDANVADAVVVEGYRIDNPAAAWVASAAVRKLASAFDAAEVRLIKQAACLFGIGDEMFEPVTVNPTITVSDGVNSAEFCIYDKESLNKAASELLKSRRELPYSFAHDCAVALQEESVNQGLSFDSDIIVPIRKLAGDYNVDFEAGRKLLDSAVVEANNRGMREHAEVLSKIANMCTSDCSPSAAPYFISALDEFYSTVPGVRKTASTDGYKYPEEVFYLSTAEYKAQQGAQVLRIDGNHGVSRSAIAKSASDINRWASTCGYNIAVTDTPEQVVAKVSGMPSALRDEFVELFA